MQGVLGYTKIMETSAAIALQGRLNRAMKRAIGVATDDAVNRALERPSDMSTVIELLRSTLPLLATEQDLDPDLTHHLAALEAEEDLIIQAGGLKDPEWVAKYLAISPKSVAAKARRNELLAITRGDRNLYPAFQFRKGQVIPGLREVLQTMALTNGWSRLSFLLTPDPGLDDRSPLDMLAGDREAVLALAAQIDAQGAS